ncbi:hypothetical protein CEXT_167961 [Caerostris extrusa]|uniref:Uncharacterized protein n=1 Tax=Caerostris extrusa TaxID=172846 RepID=A0AAV4PWX9_CAEEX|nr:hypothetical protein CEXT_167961 [Caerostris extrusa]
MNLALPDKSDYSPKSMQKAPTSQLHRLLSPAAPANRSLLKRLNPPGLIPKTEYQQEPPFSPELFSISSVARSRNDISVPVDRLLVPGILLLGRH